MKRLSRARGILFFYLFDLALLLLFVLSFFPFMHRRQPRSRELVLLNPAARDSVCAVDLSRNDGEFWGARSVSLVKRGGIWLGSSSDGNHEFIWPADTQLVEKLLVLASSSVSSYEMSSSRRDWDNFGVREQDAFSLCFSDSSHRTLSSLLFGNEDSLTGRVAVRSAADTAVYAVDAGILPLLSADESFWADPFLYPQCLTGLGRAEADGQLRRGRLENIRPREGLAVDYVAKLYFGNGAEILFSVYRKDAAYIVIPTLLPGPAVSDEDRQALQAVNYRYSISGVTLDNLLEACALSAEP